jgi:hypothetical protein
MVWGDVELFPGLTWAVIMVKKNRSKKKLASSKILCGKYREICTAILPEDTHHKKKSTNHGTLPPGADGDACYHSKG